MDTEKDLYIAWLEVQMSNDALEEEWRESRRGIDDGKEEIETLRYGTEEAGRDTAIAGTNTGGSFPAGS